LARNILKTDDIIITEFFGGKGRGSCFQINVKDCQTGEWRMIRITRSQLIRIIDFMVDGVK